MKVLVLDDDRIALRATLRMLRTAGHDVTSVENTSDAVRAIEHAEPQFEALVVDHDLGEERSGSHVSRFLRKFLGGGQLVIVYTGNPVEAAREAPAGAFVVRKPSVSGVLDALERGGQWPH